MLRRAWVLHDADHGRKLFVLRCQSQDALGRDGLPRDSATLCRPGSRRVRPKQRPRQLVAARTRRNFHFAGGCEIARAVGGPPGKLFVDGYHVRARGRDDLGLFCAQKHAAHFGGRPHGVGLHRWQLFLGSLGRPPRFHQMRRPPGPGYASTFFWARRANSL